jgi:hypothetical protein
MRLLAILGAIAFCLAPTAVAAQYWGKQCAIPQYCKYEAQLESRDAFLNCMFYRTPKPPGESCRDVADQAAAQVFQTCIKEGRFRPYCIPQLTCLLDDGRPPICCLPGDTAENGRCVGPALHAQNPPFDCWLQGKVWVPSMSDHCQAPCPDSNDSYLCAYWQNAYVKNPQDMAFTCCRSDMTCKSGYIGLNKQGQPYGAPRNGDWGCRPP